MTTATDSEDGKIWLDADTLAELDEGVQSMESERLYTWEEAKEFARSRRRSSKFGTELPNILYET